MTSKTAKSTKPAAKKAKRLSLSKQTLKDLSSRGRGPKGGMGIKIVLSHCTTCPASCRSF